MSGLVFPRRLGAFCIGIALLVNPLSMTVASAAEYDFLSLPDDGLMMLDKNEDARFIACWKTRERTYLLAQVNGTWRRLAPAHITLDNTGACDIDFPYMHQYKWKVNIVPKKVNGTRLLTLGLGLGGKPIKTKQVGVYANLQESFPFG